MYDPLEVEDQILTETEKKYGARVWCPDLGLFAGLDGQERLDFIKTLNKAQEEVMKSEERVEVGLRQSK